MSHQLTLSKNKKYLKKSKKMCRVHKIKRKTDYFSKCITLIEKPSKTNIDHTINYYHFY